MEQKLHRVVMTTESNYESNIYNYSESGNHFNASSSLGAIIQGTGNGSFIGLQNYNRSRGTTLRSLNPNGSKESTKSPFNCDENSLMNLSNTPSMIRNSTYGAERIISSTKLNHKNSMMI